MFSAVARRRLIAAAATMLATATLAACGDDDASTAGGGERDEVRVALDWTPNTNHIGLFVAQARGYFAEERLDVTFLPYAETTPETLLDKGRAEFGVSYQAGVAYARAAGQDVQQVYATVQKNQYAIAVREDSGIQSPRQLDGKTYAGFGSPDEEPMLQAVIKADGGKGDFKTVALDTAVYEAVYGGRADFAISVQTWDGVEARLSDKPVRYLRPGDYGFPNQYSSAIASSGTWLKANPDVAKRFLKAVAKGYQYAADEPETAADLLIAENPSALKNRDLVVESAKKLANEGYLVAEGKPIGSIDEQVWEEYGGFLYENGLLTDANQKPVTAEPDWASYFTNDYLPQR